LRVFLAFAVEYPVIRFHDLEDNLAVSVVEEEVGCQEIASADGHLLQSPAEVENNVIHDHGRRKGAERLAKPIRREKDIHALAAR
jgi:hypothetical protein